MILTGLAGRVCHFENVKSYMSYLQQYRKIIKPWKLILVKFDQNWSVHEAKWSLIFTFQTVSLQMTSCLKILSFWNFMNILDFFLNYWNFEIFWTLKKKIIFIILKFFENLEMFWNFWNFEFEKKNWPFLQFDWPTRNEVSSPRIDPLRLVRGELTLRYNQESTV